MPQRPMREPFNRTTPTLRFGVKLGSDAVNGQTPGFGSGAIGWAVIQRPAYIKASGGVTKTIQVDGDPISAFLELYRAQANETCDGVVLYEYADGKAYFDTRPQREGMKLKDHRILIKRAADKLRRKGVNVEIVTVRVGSRR